MAYLYICPFLHVHLYFTHVHVPKTKMYTCKYCANCACACVYVCVCVCMCVWKQLIPSLQDIIHSVLYYSVNSPPHMLKSRINPSHTCTTGFLTILLYCTPNESGIYITVLAIITINKPTMSNVNVLYMYRSHMNKSHRHVQTFPIHVIIFDHVHVSAFFFAGVVLNGQVQCQ